MENRYLAKEYCLTDTGVSFHCENIGLKAVFDDCEKFAKENIQMFGEYRIMQEGAKYQGVWLETQPMGGEMYATRDMEVALNNQLIFMYYQHRNGKMPGMIHYSFPWNGITPHYDWMQGDFFTKSALRMYYFIGEDKNYLKQLYVSLRDFDNYLWTYRDSDGDGCLEAWCVWDTGEDNCSKILANGVIYPEEGAHVGEKAPDLGHGYPFESAEYMAYSYAHCIALARISEILRNGEFQIWLDRAKKIQKQVREYLWNETKKAVYDRDCKNHVIDCLTLENLKCMYHGLFTQDMADDFIQLHLFNPNEFGTPLPLCYIAANDPLFYLSDKRNNFSEELRKKNLFHGDVADNSWSGPVEGLTVQRSLDALIGYGHHAEASIIGRKWLENLARCRSYVQQYDPIYGTPAPGVEGYGPTVLSALEYITYLYGIDFVDGRLIFSCSNEPFESEYTQVLFGHKYILRRKNGYATIYMDDKAIFTATLGARIFTDINCNVIRVSGMESKTIKYVLNVDNMEYYLDLKPNLTAEFNNGFININHIRFDI